MRTNQVRKVSVDTIVLLSDLGTLVNDVSLPGPRCLWPVYLNHEFHVSQALANVSWILRLAIGRQHLCGKSHGSEVIPYLVSLIDYNVDGGNGR